MGGVCSGAMPSMPGPPEIEAPSPEEIMELLQSDLAKIPGDIKDLEEKLPEEIRKADPEKFTPENTTMNLDKDSTPEDIRKAAILSVCGATLREEIKAKVWEQIEPKLDEQIPPECPAPMKKKALEVAQKPIDDTIDKAIDQLLEKMNSGAA
jgi:hypothetical protein